MLLGFIRRLFAGKPTTPPGWQRPRDPVTGRFVKATRKEATE